MCTACEKTGATVERAAVVSHLRGEAAKLYSAARNIPLSAAIDGGPFDDAPRFNLAMVEVRALVALADAIEAGEHRKLGAQ